MTTRRCLPDPAAGRLLRTLAIGLVIACAATCARGGEPSGRAATRRIVAIGGPVTEIVFALGAGDRVVAVDSSSVYPAEAARRPQVGYQRTLSAEGVLAYAPDLVIASADAGPPAAIAQLRAAGVAVALIPTAATVDEAVQRIIAVGDAVHDRPRATELAARTLDAATRARQRAGDRARRAPSAVVLYARGAGTVMLGGAGTPAAAMLELAGARNAVAGFTGYKPIAADAIVEAAPDAIVIPARGLASLGGESGLLALPGIAATPAGRARRIVAIDDLLLLGFGPRLADAIAELAQRLDEGAGS